MLIIAVYIVVVQFCHSTNEIRFIFFQKRRSLSLKEKLQIIEDVEEKGLSYATIAANLHVNESTIRTIIRQKCDTKKDWASSFQNKR